MRGAVTVNRKMLCGLAGTISAVVVGACILVPLPISFALRTVIGAAALVVCAVGVYLATRARSVGSASVIGGVVGGIVAAALLAYVVVPFQGLPKDTEVDGTQSSDGRALVAITVEPVVDPSGGITAAAKVADNVYIARVVEVESPQDRGGATTTTYKVDVSDVLKGAAPTDGRVTALGGETSHAIYSVPGQVAPVVGRQYAFLTKGGPRQNVIPGLGVIDTRTASAMGELRSALHR